MKIRVVFEGTPRCANSTEEYEEWRRFSRFQFLPAGFCTDCTPDYKCKMMREGRCDYPEIEFDENDDGYLPEDYNDKPTKPKKKQSAKSTAKDAAAIKRSHERDAVGTSGKKAGVFRHTKKSKPNRKHSILS